MKNCHSKLPKEFNINKCNYLIISIRYLHYVLSLLNYNSQLSQSQLENICIYFLFHSLQLFGLRIYIVKANRFQKGYFKVHHPIFGQSGLRMGSLLGVIYDIHRVRTNPEVRIGEFGASHDPGGGTNTKNLYFLSKKWAMKCIRNIPSKTDWPLSKLV